MNFQKVKLVHILASHGTLLRRLFVTLRLSGKAQGDEKPPQQRAAMPKYASLTF